MLFNLGTIVTHGIFFFRKTLKGSHKSDACTTCTRIDGQLQRAKILIKKLLRRVNQLKRSVQEKDCQNCELCSKILSENDFAEHSCVGELLTNGENQFEDFLNRETPISITDTDIPMDEEVKDFKVEAKSEKPTPPESSNVHEKVKLNNLVQNLPVDQKCNVIQIQHI